MTNWLEYHEQPVQLHSGGTSHWLVRGDLMLLDKYLRMAVVDHWLASLQDIAPLWYKQGRGLVFSIYGVPTGGSEWAAYLAGALNAKGWTANLTSVWPVVGYTIVVDDVVTTGASLERDKIAHSRLVVVDRRVKQDNELPVTAWARMHLPLVDGNGSS